MNNRKERTIYKFMKNIYSIKKKNFESNSIYNILIFFLYRVYRFIYKRVFSSFSMLISLKNLKKSIIFLSVKYLISFSFLDFKIR